ncbi:MAG: hypothetical protein OHK0031_06710 [Anaerolineales bacterium]
MTMRAPNLPYRNTRFLGWDVNDMTAWLTGLLSLFYVTWGGQLYLGEIVLIGLAPLLLVQRGRALFRNRHTRIFLLLGGLWFGAQILTDLARHTPTADLVRGWSSIGVFLTSAASLYLLTANQMKRITIFGAGYLVSNLAALWLQPSPYFNNEPWKFGFGLPLTLLLFLLVSLNSRKQPGQAAGWLGALIFLSLTSIYLGARALGALTAMSAIFLWLRFAPLTKHWLARAQVKNLLFLLLIFAVSGLGLLQGYVFAAQQNWLGNTARQKLETQYNGSLVGILVSGRADTFISIQAILDSPWLGHGSWAKNADYRLYYYKIRDMGYQINLARMENYVSRSDLIPAHSHLTQAWVWSGLAGALFWGWIGLFILQTLLTANQRPNQLYPLLIFLALSGLWDIFFSPFGSSMRLLWAFRFVIFLLAHQPQKQ